jgi:beta-glucosidase
MQKDYPFQNSALPLEERIQDLVSRLTRDEKIGFLPSFQTGIERLGVKGYMAGGEGAHGAVHRPTPSTAFPQTQALATTWDRSLLHRAGAVTGTESRAFYNTEGQQGGIELFCPTIDMERDPRWGRTEEAYGEDPFLSGELSSEYIQGAQGDDPFYLRVTCGPKHFFANNNEKDRVACNCSVPARALNEYYLAPFKIAFVKGKAKSLMTAYNEVNGIPMMLHPIVRKKVKDEWGCDGHITTDGGDFLQTVTHHHYFATHAETLAACLKAGGDEMLDGTQPVIEAAKEALEKGLLTEAELDRTVANLLRLRFRLGEFDPPEKNPYAALGKQDVNTEASKALAREAVRKSVVLLKNEGNLLPLAPSGAARRKILVTGPIADVVYLDWYSGTPDYKITALQGIREQFPHDEIVYADHRDIVSFTTADGRPVVLAGAEAVLSVGKAGESPARFYREDWGSGSLTLRNVDSGLFLDIPPKPQPNPMDPNPPPPPPEDAEPWVETLRANAETTFNWFITTLYSIIPQEGGVVLWKAWDNRRLCAPPAGGAIELAANPVDQSGEFFKLKVERKGFDEVAKAARSADTVIVFVGNDPLINSREEVDRTTLDLPPRQEALVNLVAGINPRTILSIISSYPYTCGKLINKVPAVLWAAHGLQEFGHGFADILAGAAAPAGRLTMTWYQDLSQLPSMMEYDIISARTTYQYFPGPVLFPFGYGLSYSSFTYSALSLSASSAGAGDKVTVSFKLKNSGAVKAEEVPQLYVSVSPSRVRRPLKTLKGFDRIALEPGEERAISFSLPVDELALWDVTRDKFCVEAGVCEVLVGASSADIRLAGKFEVKGETIPPRSLAAGLYAHNFDGYRNCYLHEKRGSDIPAVFANAVGAAAGADAATWTAYEDSDFGAKTAAFSALVSGRTEGRIEIRLDSPEGRRVGIIQVPHTEEVYPQQDLKFNFRRTPTWALAEGTIEPVSGVHTLYLVFHGETALWNIRWS